MIKFEDYCVCCDRPSCAGCPYTSPREVCYCDVCGDEIEPWITPLTVLGFHICPLCEDLIGDEDIDKYLDRLIGRRDK